MFNGPGFYLLTLRGRDKMADILQRAVSKPISFLSREYIWKCHDDICKSIFCRDNLCLHLNFIDIDYQGCKNNERDSDSPRLQFQERETAPSQLRPPCFEGMAWRRFPIFCPFVMVNHRSPEVYPNKRPVIRIFDVFFVVSLNSLLKKESICRWFATFKAT